MKTFKWHTMKILSIMVIPITIWLIIFNIYTIFNVSRESRSQNYEDKLSLIVQNIEYNLTQTESFMIPFINNSNFKILGYHSGKEMLFNASQQLIPLYDPLNSINRNITGILIYSSPNDFYRIIINDYVNTSDFVEYLKRIQTGVNSYPNKWYIASIDNSQYFIRIMNEKGAYQMCFINTDKIISSYLGNTSPNETIAILTDDKASALRTDAALQKEVLDKLKGKNSVLLRISNISYIVTKLHSDYLNLDFLYAAPYNLNISLTQIILIIVSIILMATLIPLGTYKFIKTCLTPLDSLLGTMNRIKGGNINERCNVVSNIDEYKQLEFTFNEMLEQIKNLKIESYENELEAQKTELQYRHVQIRPHFFLNCMKTLYGLAECRDYNKLQDVILSFSVYFRGIFGSSQMLSIKDELILVSNYIKLQTSSSIMNITYKENIEPRTEAFTIPSLTILTFVENSIKYGHKYDLALTINVNVKLIEGDGMNYLNITISDNGPGFQNDDILKLNKGYDLEFDDGTHIGISNIKRRCRLIYGDEATITFMQSNGAMIELFLPIKESPEKQE